MCLQAHFVLVCFLNLSSFYKIKYFYKINTKENFSTKYFTSSFEYLAEKVERKGVRRV